MKKIKRINNKRHMKGISALLTKIIDYLYITPLRKWMPLQTFRYAACGALNMALDTVFYFISYHYIFNERNFDLGFIVISPHIAALCLVFPITFFNGFLLNKYVAFKESPLRGRIQLFRYGLSVVGALAMNYALMKIFVETLNIFPTPSKILTTGITVIYSYLVQKYFTFRGCPEE